MDLMEPLRPSLDRFVLHLIDTNLNVDDFIQKGKESCFLTKRFDFKEFIFSGVYS
ncbi:CRISPR-associated protein Cas1 [Candidatus Magnetomorum sp. HK-1]|nr:CRISPR-associated protein Cas1 [Candidatus Magnetomorum sp. HK-1]